MKIKQTSVVLENTEGKLFELTSLLHRFQIDIRSFFVNEEAEFSAVHMILDKPDLALKVLKENGYLAREVDVFALKAEDRPGGLLKVLTILKDHKLNIEYVYGFGEKHEGKAIFVFRITDIDQAIKVIQSGLIESLPHERVVGGQSASSWELVEHL
ncbi:MAG: ACT domain-containing protein [Spirochaetes bacterium]|nr:ACT domain-containing protein [Spirochaetota bacterium]MBU0955476.1 ACT domain-containing protein [Spirochaetota bacterium]